MHPDRPAPSGGPSPYARVTELRRKIYGRSATDADRAEYARLTSTIERAQRAGANATEPAAANASTGTKRPRRRIARPRRAPLLGVILALVIGGVAGVVGQLHIDAAQPESIPPLAPETSVHARASLSIFARPQRADDLPVMRLGPTIMRSSIRHLTREPVTDTQLFAARDRDGDVCLLAVQGSVYTAACVTRAGFGRAGVVLPWTQSTQASTGSGRVDVPVLAEWLPSGAVVAQANL